MILALTLGHNRSDTRNVINEFTRVKVAEIPVRNIVADGTEAENINGVVPYISASTFSSAAH